MYSIEAEKEKKYYVLSGNKGFFLRYCDNGFKTKWAGLWRNSKKYLEYYYVKGLEEKNCIKTEYDYVKTKHFYRKGTETIFIPKNSSALYVKIKFLKGEETEIELAVNIRKREENLTNRKYKIKFNKEKKEISIFNSIGELKFCLLKGEMEFKKKELKKIHFPSGEKQNCFIPGRIKVKGKEIIFALIPEPKKEKKLNERKLKKELNERKKEKKEIEKLIECNSKEIKKGFINAGKGLMLLKNQENFFAGYPWFLQYWGRDNLWSLNALISLGKFEEAEKILLYFWKKNRKGRIPNFIEEKKIHFNSIDSSLLFLTALNNYVFASGNKKILNKIKYRKVLLFLQSKEKEGLIFHEGNETWMDSIERKGAAIEVQALYLKALHSTRNLMLLEEKTKEAHEIEKKAVKLNQLILNKFKTNGNYRDLLNERNEFTKTCNPLVYLMQKKAEEKEIELFESNEFNSVKGIITLGKKEKEFNPEEYHKGMAWSLSTAWMSCAEFKAERKEKGLHYLKKLIGDLNDDCIGGIGECWNLQGKLKGCGMQLWGHAFVIKTIDEFMLGIKLNAFEKKIYLKPKLPEEVNYIERKLRIENNWFNLIIQKKEKQIKAKTTNKNIKIEFY
jgi:glycogen debranching enzyme